MKCLTNIFLFSLFSYGACFAANCGSDGPKPFFAVTKSPTVKSIYSKGEVKEFVYWENRNSILYRNSQNELRATRLSNGQDKLFATSSFPLSRVADPTERYVVSREGNRILDTQKNEGWQEFDTDAGKLMHLYWNRGRLMSIDIDDLLFGQNLSVYMLDKNGPDFESKFQCNEHLLWGGYRLGRGHQHPYIFLYKIHPATIFKPTRMSFYQMNVTTCDIIRVGGPTEQIHLPVEAVHRFEDSGGIAVVFGDERYRVRWEQGGRCRYHSVKDPVTMFPTVKHPVMVSWDANKGLSVYNLSTQKKVTVKRTDIVDISETDLWVPNRGGELLMSPTNSSQQRHLLGMEIEEIIPSRHIH